MMNPLALVASLFLVQTFPVETDLLAPGIPETHTVWVEMIRAARKEIRIGQFYVSNAPNSRLEPVLKALETKAAQGVKVKLLLDESMLSNDRATYDRLRSKPGIEVRAYPLKRLTGGIIHAKYFTIDGEKLFVGSQNLDWRALEHIHEMGLMVKDPVPTRALDRIFDIDWEIARTGHLPTPKELESYALPEAGAASPRQASGTQPNGERKGGPAAQSESETQVEVVASPPELTPPGITPALDRLIELLGSAQESIEIQVMDFSLKRYGEKKEPWEVLDRALKDAAARKVEVRLLVADWSTTGSDLATLKSLAATPGIEVSVCKIPQSTKGFIPFSRVIHSKYLIVDRKTLWLGTSNWSHGYFMNSRNVELVVQNPRLARQALGVFERLWSQPFAQIVTQSSQFPPPRKGE